MADLDIPPLFAQSPHLLSRVARVPLGTFPTRVERLRNLEKRLGFRSLWIKRDDLSGRLHGGNKVRKLEYLLAGVAGVGGEGGYTAVAYGPLSSNWTLSCAIYGRYLGAQVRLLLFRMKGVPEKRDALSLLENLSAGVEVLASPVLLPVKLLGYFLSRSPGSRLAVMPPGGTSPKSILGYVNAFLELSVQVRSGILPMPDVIVLPMGTGGTAAGLAAGAALGREACRVVGVRVASSFFANTLTARALANASLRIIAGGRSAQVKVARETLQVDGSFCGAGYGMPTPAAEEAVRTMEGEEGLTLDATYTAKTVAMLIGRAAEGWGRGLNVLYWHTLNSIPLEKVRQAFS